MRQTFRRGLEVVRELGNQVGRNLFCDGFGDGAREYGKGREGKGG